MELPQFFVPTFSKFLVRMLGKCLEVFTPLTLYFKMAAYILSEVYSQFQIALPRALANFIGKLETTYRTSKFGSQLANEPANFDLKFATSPAQKYGT